MIKRVASDMISNAALLPRDHGTVVPGPQGWTRWWIQEILWKPTHSLITMSNGQVTPVTLKRTIITENILTEIYQHCMFVNR